ALKDEPNFFVPQISEFIATERPNIHPGQIIFTRSGTVEATQRVKHRRFPRTTRAHDRHEFLWLNVERYAPHGVHFHFAADVNLAEVLELDDRVVGHERDSTLAESRRQKESHRMDWRPDAAYSRWQRLWAYSHQRRQLHPP